MHAAFLQPGTINVQISQMPDGATFFCIARTVLKAAGGYGEPRSYQAIGLGCEIGHTDALVYADGMDLSRRADFDPIGISCRICERRDCHQRAVPPLERPLRVDPDSRGVLPYEIG